MKLENYGFIGDMETGALVGENGSIDWLCMPRFDSPAAFAVLLGDDDNGCWKMAPTSPGDSRQRYRPETLVLTRRSSPRKTEKSASSISCHPEARRRIWSGSSKAFAVGWRCVPVGLSTRGSIVRRIRSVRVRQPPSHSCDNERVSDIRWR